jgi:transcriptional regulator
MSVYQPPAFVPQNADAALQLVQEYPFATLITQANGEAQVSHLPLLHRAEAGTPGELIGHMARANPHWQRFAEGATLALFHGPHAYVSPSWYLEPEAAVPTWNYAVVHVRARAVVVPDRESTVATVNALTQRFESGRPQPWALQLTGARLDAMLGAIVAFRLVIERIDAKFKLSQNRSAQDRVRVAAALRDEDYAEAGATADWMQRHGGSV